MLPTPVQVAVLDDYQGVALRCGDWSSIAGAAVTAFADHLEDEDALVARLAPFQVVCLMRERTPLSDHSLARLPQLKLIVTTGMWNASLDIEAAVRRGIVVCGTSSIQSGTPELTWLLILALARGLPQEQASISGGGWQTGLGVDLEGSTLGILGLGKIGARIATVGNSFGMRVLAWSENLTAARASAAGAALVAKDALLREADFVTVHMKLSERTRGLIGARELSLMKPSAYLINTSRGPIVAETALVEAMQGGRIAGAGLDVFDREPLPAAHPLRRLSNAIVTPHIGYVTARSYALFYSQVVENIRAWIAVAPIRLLSSNALPGAVQT